ncbi:MAG: hypothetical protein KJO77_03640 [Bacteroidia bacterium]|nr:hypothetical protein [Bacteroidia bacterium]NND52647.1 hypothetical protein [Flavobacteriaceae bacterium]
MTIRTYIILVALTIGFVTLGFSQPQNYEIKNGFFIGGGLTQFDITTDNFQTKQGSGWMISSGIGAYLPHKWFDISYNIQLLQNKFEMSGRMTDDVAGDELIEYEMFAAQAGLIFHINVIGPYLTIDLGPQLQYNGELEVANGSQESYFLNGYDALGAMDIAEITQFNVNAMGGVSFGYGPIKARAQYIYGLTNTFEKLNGQNLNTGTPTKFKGNQSMLTFAAFFTF